MHFDLRVLVFWAANLLLFLLAMLVNSQLSPFSLYMILLGPMLVLPALRFNPPLLILCSFITGLSLDALLPQPYWLFVYGFPVIGLFIRSIRSHFRTETSYRFVLLAHIANLASIALLYVSQGIYFEQFSASLMQVLSIILLSHTILCIVAPWFFSFERLLFHLLKIEYANEDEFSVL